MITGSATLLGEAEFLGRFAAHLHWVRMGDLFRLDPDNPDLSGVLPGVVPVGGDLTIDGSAGPADHQQLIRRWSEELARASGAAVWGNSRKE